jgi:hypothetical protein
VDKNWERLGKLPMEEKILICMDMSDACIQICADYIKSQNPNITEEELIEKVRERLAFAKRHQKR